MATCERCLLGARETALDNYLDAENLRQPHPDYPGSFTYDPATVDWDRVEAEAQALMTWAPEELGWHDGH